MLNIKSDSTKSLDKYNHSKTFNSPILAWSASHDHLDAKVNKEKSSKFSLFKLKNKKNFKKVPEIFLQGSQNQNACLNNAFSVEIKSKKDRKSPQSDYKASDENIISYRNSEDFVTIYPLKVDQCNKSESDSVKITVVSSDESDKNGDCGFESTKTKPKKNTKKKKENFEISDVIYFKNDLTNGKISYGENDFPWTPISYNPDTNEDVISNESLNIYQLINILNHPIYKNKTVLIDLRIYDQYRKNPVFGALHFSEFQNEDLQLSFEKVKDDDCSIVILLFSQYKHNISIRVDETIKVLNMKCDSEIKEQSISFLSNSLSENSKCWMSFTCFDHGSLFVSENFDLCLKYLPDLNFDVIVTDCKTKIYQRFSEINSNNTPNIVSITSNQITNGEYSEKHIMNSDLMAMLDHLSTFLDNNHRSVIMYENHDHLSVIILIIILMYKNRWSIHDSIACIKYVRCQQVTIKPIYLTILKHFEKLFFGKRLYSGGNKSKSNKEFAFEL